MPWFVDMCVLSCFSHVQLFVTLWTVARQAPLSMGFSRQEYWTGLPHPSPGDLPNPGIKSASLIRKNYSNKVVLMYYKTCLKANLNIQSTEIHSQKKKKKFQNQPLGFSVHGILQARILDWVAIPFSRGSSRPRDWIWVSCIAGRFFTTWATREAPAQIHKHTNLYLIKHIILRL